MRTETEILDVILQTAKVLQVDAVALSGSRATPKALKDEFQDYDVVYLVENLDSLVDDLAWLDRFGKRMIEQHVREIIGRNCGARVIISVPGGEETAKLTYNSRLGIVGGISILGTTGIVNPMSEDSWKASITIELTMLYNQGHRSVVLVPGNYGEDFATNSIGIPAGRIVNMSNFVGHVLKEVQRIGFTKVLMIGHMGKFVKVAAGIFSTHSKDSDARMETLVANLALMGAPMELLEKVDKCLTTEAAGTAIKEFSYEGVYQVLADKIKARSERLLRYRKPEVSIEVVVFGTEEGYLASTQPLEQIKDEWI